MSQAKQNDPKYQRMLDGQAQPQQQRYTPHVRNVSDSLSHKFMIYMNLFFVLLGGVVIGIGYHLKNSHAGSFLKENFGLGLVVLGAAVLIISLIGCLSAKLGSRCLILLYSLILLVLIICQVGVAAMIVTRSNEVDKVITNRWDSLDQDHQHDLEEQFNCCGLYHFNDTQAAQPCPMGSSEGCIDKLESDLKKEMLAVGAAALAFALLEVLGVLCACALASNIKNANEAEDDENERLQQAKEVNRTIAVGTQV